MLLRMSLFTCLLFAFSPDLSADESTLADRLTPLAHAHKGKVAIAVLHLDSGVSFYYQADEVMPTASLIKFPVLIELYQQVLEGKLRITDLVTLREKDKVPGSGILTYHFSEGASFPLRDAARLMIAYSDNTATNLILDKVGIASTAQRMEAWGFPNTKIHAQVFKGSTTSVFPERTKKYGLGSTTAREMVQLLQKLHQGKLVSPDASKEMLDHLKKCEDKDKIKRFLPEKTVVAHKTGSVSDVKTDAGIMYLPEGPVALCILTADNQDKRYHAENEASILCGRVAREVYDFFVAQAKSIKK